MADEPGQEPSSFDSSDGAGDEVVSEQELDDLLAEASALANEISADVGQPPSESEDFGTADPTATPLGSTNDDVGDPPPDIDAQLAEVDDLLSRADAQLGVSDDASPFHGPPEPTQALEEPTTWKAPPAATETPEPQELTNDSAQPDGADAVAGEDSLAGRNPSDLFEPWAGEPSLKDPVGPAAEPPADSASQAPADPGELADGGAGQATGSSPGGTEVGEDHGEPDASSTSQRSARLVPFHSCLRYVSPPAQFVGERVAGLLEVMDRPTHRLGAGARQAIGWFAIATLGTSLIVILISLF